MGKPYIEIVARIAHDTLLLTLVGCGSGVAGMTLALILHSVQHLSYSYSLEVIIGPESFLQGVSAASPVRRVVVLVLCGITAGVGWYGLRRYGRPLTSVSSALGKDLTPMPFLETMVHGLLQMITVGMGSPLGREVAPRELGALLAQQLTKKLVISPEKSRLLVACGAGAGLAAVYDVPAAATLFVMEVLLREFRLKVLCYAAFSCTLAAWLARTELGPNLQYSIQSFEFDQGLFLWAVIIGPVIGTIGFAFSRWTKRCEAQASTGVDQVWKSVLAFAAVGLISTALPALLGNGKGPAELAFTGGLTATLAAVVITAKVVCITLVLRAGARGGLLTPGFSLGALLAVVFGGIVGIWFTVPSPGALAIIGAAAFLSSSMAMPVTAVLISMEFMDAPAMLFLPIVLSVAGATVARRVVRRSIRKTPPSVVMPS